MNRTNLRKKYWENYTQYWKERTSIQIDTYLSKNDSRPSDINIFSKYYEIACNEIKCEKNNVLDIGISFGRFIPIYKNNFGNKIWGTDISANAISECSSNFPFMQKKLFVAPAEKQPFENNNFSLIICWATFDATHQDMVLWEIQRLLRVGGIALITGKNSKYLKSDRKAFIAEVNARKKGHPNYFTNIDKLIKNIDFFGLKVSNLFCFKKRGDFSGNLFIKGKENRFYEYALIVKKNKNVKKKKTGFKISGKFSQTFKEKNV